MKLLYLDTMDLGRLGDGKWGGALDELARTLQGTDAVLVLSHLHLTEAVGIGVEGAHARFSRILDAGIQPLLFNEDPRDAELAYLKALFEDQQAPSAAFSFHEMTRANLGGWLDDAACGYAELRELHSGVATAEFFSVRANARSHLVRVADTLAEVERTLANPDLEAQWAKAQELDLAGGYDAATLKRFAKANGESVSEVINRLRPQVAGGREATEDVLRSLREMLDEYDIDLYGDDQGISWGELLELVMIRKRAMETLSWLPPRAVVEFLVANRIPFAIDAMRHLDTQRVSEPGDLMDSGHAMHLPCVSVMTADKRTVEWLRASKNQRIAQHAARIYRGGNVDNLKAALQALDTSPVFGTRAS